MSLRTRWMKSAAMAWIVVVSACGGPATLPVDVPAQTAGAYWVGVEVAGAVHLHIEMVQTGNSLSLLPNCDPARCSLLPFNNDGIVYVGSPLPVTITSVTGTFTNPAITFTFVLSNGRTFTFTGRVAEDSLMTGKISGATLPETTITFEKSITT